jgi:hypothetical protein
LALKINFLGSKSPNFFVKYFGENIYKIGPREVFDAILRDLKRRLGRDVSGVDDDDSVANFSDFVAKLADLLAPPKSGPARNCVIALSSADVLRQMDAFLLPGFLNLESIS